MKSSLFLLVFLLSCSQLTKKKSKPEPVSFTPDDIRQCQEYKSNVLDKSYKEVKANDDVVLVFTSDEKEARESFSQFSLQKSLIHLKAGLVENALYSCDPESLKKFDDDYRKLAACTTMFSEYRYFQALAAALNTYPWPIDLKLEGKKISLDYVRFYSEGRYPLLNRLLALSVLDELSLNQVVSKDLHPEIKGIMTESQVYVEGLKKKLTKDQKLTCEGLDIMRDELEYSEVVAKKMKSLLTKI